MMCSSVPHSPRDPLLCEMMRFLHTLIRGVTLFGFVADTVALQHLSYRRAVGRVFQPQTHRPCHRSIPSHVFETHAWLHRSNHVSTALYETTRSSSAGAGAVTVASTARAGSDGYSVTRQPAQWMEDTSDPVFAIPESLRDDTTSTGRRSVDEDWWQSSSPKSRRGSQATASPPTTESDGSEDHTLNLAQRTLDTLDVPRLWQALLLECTTVPAKRLVQHALGAATNGIMAPSNSTMAKAVQPLIAETVEGCQERYRAVQEMIWILDQTEDSASSIWDEEDLLVTYPTTGSTGTPKGPTTLKSSSKPVPLYLLGRPPPLDDALAWERIVEVAVTEGRVLDGLDIQNVATMLDCMVAMQAWKDALVHQCRVRNERRQDVIDMVEIPALLDSVRVNATLQGLLHTALDPFVESANRGKATVTPSIGRLSGETFPVIGRLRAQIKSLKQDILSTLETLVASPSMQSKLSLESGGPMYSELTSSGRLVIPVDKQYSTSGVAALGIVHDTSRSGKTVYIEPNEIIGPTNALKQAESALRTEEGRVWRMLTEQVLNNRNDIEISVAALGQVDLILARIRLGRLLNGVIPVVHDEGVIALRNAKHPILLLRRAAAQSSAPVDIMGNNVALGAGENQGLVLTGPNAGGKTVILKLLGLVALMARSGIPVPADKTANRKSDDLTDFLGRYDDEVDASYQPRVDFFNPVLADIGDLQSVGGDLSTFSGHMLVCREVLNNAGRNALVLMDELGSGTDPNQGVAIAQALLEAVLATGARVAITTHYLQLKQLAATDDRFSVAGMQFVNGRPTYKLLPGTVGESYALAVAERLGLPPAVLARANELLDSETRQMGDLIREMEDQKAVVDQQVAALAEKQKEMAVMELKIKEEAIRLENKQLDARRIEARKFAKLLEEKEAVLEDILEKLKSDPSRRVLAKSWDDIKFVKRDALNEAENVPSVMARKQKAAAAMEEASADLVPIAELRDKPVLKEGDLVIICDQGPMLGREATVIKALDSRVEVKVNNMNVSFKLSQLALPPKKHRGSMSQVTARTGASSRSKAVDQALASEGVHRKSVSETENGSSSSSGGVAMRTESNTVDVRGCNLLEAQEKVRDKCSTAFLAGGGRPVVYILHGHGTGGVLKSKIRAWLKSERQLVKQFGPADRLDGGDALTRVDLR